VLVEFAGWRLERGSTFCHHDPNSYFLKLQDPSDAGHIEYRMSLPPAMNAKVNELYALAQTPDEQSGEFPESIERLYPLKRCPQSLMTVTIEKLWLML